MDDFSNTRSTTGVLNLNSPLAGDIESVGDVDWFHANLTGWVEIRVEAIDSSQGTLQNPVLKSIFAPDDNGRLVQFVDNDGGQGRDSTLRIMVDNADLFLAVASITRGTGSYRIIAEQFLDHADSFAEVPSSILFGQVADTGFEDAADHDIFRTELLRFNRMYEIKLNLDQYLPGANDWQISIYDPSQNLVEQVAVDADEVKYIFNPPTDGQYFVSIDSVGHVGGYEFQISPIDDQEEICNQIICGGEGNRSPLPLTGASILGDIEQYTDIDNFISDAWSGGYYVLTFGGFDDVNNVGLDNYIIHLEQNTQIDTWSLTFSGNSTRQFEVIPALNADFEIDVASDAFDDGKYKISVLETPPIVIGPTQPIPLLMALPVEGGMHLDSMIQHMGVLDNVPDTWQVWHQPGNPQVGDSGYLTEHGQVRESNQLHVVSADDFSDWQIHFQDTDSGSIAGSDEVFVRAGYKGIYTPWISLNPRFESVDPQSQSDAVWDHNVITYSFMSELPEYLSSFGGFEALSADYQANVRLAMAEWDKVGAFQLVEVTDASDVDIRVGSAAFFPTAFTHAGGPGETAHAGDVLLNTAQYQVDFAAGDQLFQRLMRGIGISLGFNDMFDPSITVSDSIMRTYSPDGVFPWQPMRLDHWLVQEKYGLDTETSVGNDRYLLTPGSAEVFTLLDAGGYDTLDAAHYVEGVNISIQQGGEITTSDGTSWVGYGTEIERLNGGQGNDVLLGNELDNKVTGRAGNDFIYGRQGNDVLLGGQGDDRYGYRLGDGNDVIFEQGKGGRDVLHLQSPLSVGNAFLGYENIMFTRQASDLILQFTNSPHRTINDTNRIGPSEGSMRIRNMDDPNSAVEILRLDDGYHNLQSPIISLGSIYNRLSDGQSSFFQASAVFDQWGVVPDFAFPT